jgi:hypothetical protein
MACASGGILEVEGIEVRDVEGVDPPPPDLTCADSGHNRKIQLQIKAQQVLKNMEVPP